MNSLTGQRISISLRWILVLRGLAQVKVTQRVARGEAEAIVAVRSSQHLVIVSIFKLLPMNLGTPLVCSTISAVMPILCHTAVLPEPNCRSVLQNGWMSIAPSVLTKSPLTIDPQLKCYRRVSRLHPMLSVFALK